MDNPHTVDNASSMASLENKKGTFLGGLLQPTHALKAWLVESADRHTV
jgi:hypothetical protein